MVLCVKSVRRAIKKRKQCAYSIIYQGQKSIIETKIFVTQTRLQEGKEQLADYLKTENVNEGYYVVFSNKHSDEDALYFDEMINGKRIYTYIIRTNFERPSRRRPRKAASTK